MDIFHADRTVRDASSALPQGRRIFLTGWIDSGRACKAIADIGDLADASMDPVTIYVDSAGGDIGAALALYDAIHTANIDINIICTGLAAGAAVLVLAGGQPGARFIMPHAVVMLTDPVGGRNDSLACSDEEIIIKKKTKSIYKKLLGEAAHKTVTDIETAISCKVCMDASEAIAAGYADFVASDLRYGLVSGFADDNVYGYACGCP